MRRGLIGLGIVISLAVVAGCGASSGDIASPFAPRPFALDVSAIDPCASLTEQERDTLDLRTGLPGTSHGGSSRGCTWSSNDGLGYNLQTFDRHASAAIGTESTSQVVVVAAFGGVQSSPPAQGTGLPFCQVVLDVADNASLRAQLQVSPRGAALQQHTVETTCAQVRDVAATMLANLRAQQNQ